MRVAYREQRMRKKLTNSRGRALLAAHIERLGCAKRSFAEAAGVSPAMLSHLLSGNRSVTLTVAYQIERASDGDVPAYSWLQEHATQ